MLKPSPVLIPSPNSPTRYARIVATAIAHLRKSSGSGRIVLGPKVSAGKSSNNEVRHDSEQQNKRADRRSGGDGKRKCHHKREGEKRDTLWCISWHIGQRDIHACRWRVCGVSKHGGWLKPCNPVHTHHSNISDRRYSPIQLTNSRKRTTLTGFASVRVWPTRKAKAERPVSAWATNTGLKLQTPTFSRA